MAGTPDNYDMSIREIIESKTEPEPYSGCWIWTGGYTGGNRTVQKRPAIWMNGKTNFAARVSFQEFHGIAPHKKFVLHKCDTAACVNPAHLFLGTAKTNMQDMSRKFRGRPHGVPQKACLC